MFIYTRPKKSSEKPKKTLESVLQDLGEIYMKIIGPIDENPFIEYLLNSSNYK